MTQFLLAPPATPTSINQQSTRQHYLVWSYFFQRVVPYATALILLLTVDSILSSANLRFSLANLRFPIAPPCRAIYYLFGYLYFVSQTGSVLVVAQSNAIVKSFPLAKCDFALLSNIQF